MFIVIGNFCNECDVDGRYPVVGPNPSPTWPTRGARTLKVKSYVMTVAMSSYNVQHFSPRNNFMNIIK